MTAVVTDDLKFNVLSSLLADYNSASTEYYIGLSRSEYWDSNDAAVAPINSKYDITDFKERLQAVKKVEAASFVVPRQDWALGTIYPQWDDKRQGTLSTNKRYYVITDNYGVFICLRTGRNKQGVIQPSLVKPASSNLDPFELSDGYVWKFLYTVSALQANYFLSSQYMPVYRQETEPDSNSTGAEIKQWAVQNAEKGGRITTFVMSNTGSGYGTAGAFPNVNVYGDGQLTVGDSANNVLIKVIDSSAGTLTAIRTQGAVNNTLDYLDSYLFGEAVILPDGSGGDSARARPVIGPTPGFGYDPRKDLKGSALMFRSKVLTTDTDFILSQDFRQIGLIKNIGRGDSAPDNKINYNALTGIAINNMKLTSYTTVLSKDKTIQGVSSFAKGYIDNVDSSVAQGTKVYYHQSAETGYKPFLAGETIQEINGTGEGIIQIANQVGEVNNQSGEVLYLDNRAAVQRIANQSEDIKVIIQL
jgi:hypothetical protein